MTSRTQPRVNNSKERLFTSRRRGCAPTRCRRGRRRPRAAPVVALEGREEVPDHGVLHPRRVHPAPTTAEPELTDSPLPVPKAPRRRPTKTMDSSLGKYEQFQKRQMFKQAFRTSSCRLGPIEVSRNLQCACHALPPSSGITFPPLVSFRLPLAVLRARPPSICFRYIDYWLPLSRPTDRPTETAPGKHEERASACGERSQASSIWRRGSESR